MNQWVANFFYLAQVLHVCRSINLQKWPSINLQTLMTHTRRFRFFAASEIIPELHLQLLDGAAVRQKEDTNSTSNHPFLWFSLHNWDWKTFGIKAEPNQKLSIKIQYCIVQNELTVKNKNISWSNIVVDMTLMFQKCDCWIWMTCFDISGRWSQDPDTCQTRLCIKWVTQLLPLPCTQSHI